MNLVGREVLKHAAERHLSVQLSRARQGHRKPPLESRYGRLRSSQPADALTTPACCGKARGQQRANFVRKRTFPLESGVRKGRFHGIAELSGCTAPRPFEPGTLVPSFGANCPWRERRD